jgi:hypothetical protein
MDMEGRTEPLVSEGRLDQTEGAAGVLRASLDLHQAALPPESVRLG